MKYARMYLILVLLSLSMIGLYADDQAVKKANNTIAEGDKLADTGDLNGAIAKYEEALASLKKLDASNSAVSSAIDKVLRNLAWASSENNDIDRVVQYLTEQWDRDQTNTTYPRQIAQYYAFQKKMGQAEAVINKAIERSVNNKKAQQTFIEDMAGFYEESGNDDKAIEWYTKAWDLKKSGKYVSKLTGYYNGRGQYQKSAQLYLAYVESDPGDRNKALAYKKLGQLYQEQLKNPAKAVQYFEMAQQVKYDAGVAGLVLGIYFNDLKNLDKAFAVANEILAKNAKDPNALYIHGEILFGREEWEKAKADFEKITSHGQYGPVAKKRLESIAKKLEK